MIEILVFSFVALLLYIKFKNASTEEVQLPPGPSGLPLIGNLHQICQKPHLKLCKWATKHGKVYTIYLAGKPVLVVNDVQTMREIFGSLESTGKYQLELLEILYPNNRGIVTSEGSVWQEQQRFCVKTLKNLGFGSGSKLDAVILGEGRDLCSWIEKKLLQDKNQGIHLSEKLMQVTGNTIWNIVTGEKIRSGDCKIVEVLQGWIDMLNVATKTGLAMFPWLKYIAPEKSGYNGYVKVCQDLKNLAQGYFEHHKKLRENNKQIREDVIDAYLNQIEKCEDPASSFYGNAGFEHGLHTVMALLVGGSETTASTIVWLIFYSIAYPDVQKKMHREIDEILGRDGDPALTDRRRMKYTEAMILETLRCSTLIPFGTVFKLLDKINFDGYVLPKGLLLVANMYYANHDQNIWGDPETFRPERFINGDEATRKTLRNNVASFREGRRKCIGEQMAKDVMFLFTVKLFQKFEFYGEEGRNVEDYVKPNEGYVLLPKKLGVVIKQRVQ